MKILLLNRYYPGGQTTLVDTLAASLKRMGNDVLVSYITPPALPKSRVLFRASREAGVPVYAVGKFDQLVSQIRAFKPDVVHAHSSTVWELGYDLAKASNSAFVLTAHGLGLDQDMYRPFLEQADAILVPGPITLRSLTSVPKEKLHRFHLGIDTVHYKLVKKAGHFRVGYVGRVDPSRLEGFLALADAARVLNVELVLIGSGPAEHIPRHVKYLGWLEDPKSEIEKLTVVAGIGQSLREGMATGAVGLVLGGKHYYGVIDEKNLGLLKEKNAVDFSSLKAVQGRAGIRKAIVEDLSSLIENASLIPKLGVLNHNFIQSNFNLHAKGQFHIALYKQVVKTKKGTHKRFFPGITDPHSFGTPIVKKGREGQDAPPPENPDHPPVSDPVYDPVYNDYTDYTDYTDYNDYNDYIYRDKPPRKTPCRIKLTLNEDYLCLGQTGSASAMTQGKGTITWVLGPELRLLSGQGTLNITYSATRPGCPVVKVIKDTGKKVCVAASSLSVPEPGFTSGQGRPVKSIGVMGHPPYILIDQPVPPGSEQELRPLTSVKGDTPAQIESEFFVSGKVIDPLGTEDLKISISTSAGLLADQQEKDVDPGGSFSFTVSLKGMKRHSVVLSVTGHSGATAVQTLVCQIRYPSGYWDLLAEMDEKMKEKELVWYPLMEAYMNNHTEFGEDKLNELHKNLENDLAVIRREKEQRIKNLMQDFGAYWSSGEAAPLPDLLPEAARYKVAARDCNAWFETGMLHGHPLYFEERGGLMICTDPEAFSVLSPWGSWKPNTPPPRRPEDLVIELTSAVQYEPKLLGKYADCPLEGPLFQVGITGKPYLFLHTDKDPDTGDVRSVKNIEQEFEANAAGDGAPDIREYKWKCIYGPRLNALEIRPYGAKKAKAKVKAHQPGLYILSASAVTDHENPLAMGIFQVHAVDLGLIVHSSSFEAEETPENEAVSPPVLPLDLIEAHMFATVTYDLAGTGGNMGFNFHPVINWRGHDSNGQVRQNDSLEARYALGSSPREIIRVSAHVDAIRYTGSDGDISISSLGLTQTIETIRLKPGSVASVEVRLIYPGRTNSDWVPIYEFTGDPLASHAEGAVLGTSNSWGKFNMNWSRFSMESNDRIEIMGISLRVKDRYNNFLQAGTPILAELFGDGDLGFGDAAASRYTARLNDDGTAHFQYILGDATDSGNSPLKTLIKFNIGEKVFFLGDKLAASEVELIEIPNETRLTGNVIHSAQGAEQFSIRFRAFVTDQGSRNYLPGGTEVHLRVSDGSVKNKIGNFCPNAVVVLADGGWGTITLTPVCYNADGSRHILKFDAWGIASLNIAIGASSATYKVDYDSVASVLQRPRMRFPGMPFVKQHSYEWIGRPSDNVIPFPAGPAVPASAELAAGPLILHGANAKTGLFQFKQRLQSKPLVRFSLSGTDPVHTLDNPDFDNLVPPDPQLSFISKFETSGPPFGHVQLSKAVRPPFGADNAALHVTEGVVGTSIALALNSYLYGASFPASPGFEVSVFLRGEPNCIADCVVIEGSRTTGSRFPERGFLKISFVDDIALPHLRVQFEAEGCNGLGRSRMDEVILRVLPSQWLAVTVRVEPDMEKDETNIRVTLGLGPSARIVDRKINRFNFLPGPKYYASISVPERGSCWLSDLRINYLQSDALNFVRADGLRTPWLAVRFASATLQVEIDRQLPSESYAFGNNHVAPWAKFTAGYCDSGDWETADIAALSPEAIRVFRYISDFANGVLFGESRTVVGFAGDFGAGMLGWGDLRDIIKNLAYAFPGGQDPDWKVFWLAVLGLGLDIGQLFTGGAAAAPNAIVGIIKQLMVNLRRFYTPQSMRMARYIGVYARKILVKYHGLKIGTAVQTAVGLNEIAGLVSLLGKDFVEFFLDGLHNDLRQIENFYRNVPFPGPPDFKVTPAFVIATAGASVPATHAVTTVIKRIEILSRFFNPAIFSATHIDELCGFFRKLRKSINVDDEKLLSLLDAAHMADNPFNPALKWNVNLTRYKERANEILSESMALLCKFMTESSIANVSPQALRGLMAFTAASGPHRAMALIHNFCPGNPQVITKELLEVLHDCDYARKLVQDMQPLDHFGDVTAWGSDTRLTTLHNLWNGLSARSPDHRPYVSNVNGAIGELKALRRLGEEVKYIAQEGISYTGRLLKLQDFLISLNHGVEVKSVMSGKNLWGRVQDMKAQLDRWANINYSRHVFNQSHASIPGIRQSLVTEMTYVIIVPKNSGGRRAEFIERQLRNHIDLMNEAWDGLPVVPEIRNFEIISLDKLVP